MWSKDFILFLVPIESLWVIVNLTHLVIVNLNLSEKLSEPLLGLIVMSH
jgi:hypothetical protein